MWIALGISVLVIVYLVSLYNGVIALKEAVYTDEKAIGIQLDERNKLFDSLIATVKKFMDHEKGVFEEIVKLRSQNKSGSVDKATEEKLSAIVASGQLSSGINMTMEAYPELKSGTNMLQLQESIENIERKLANAKKAFNASIEDYNSKVESVPTIFIVNQFQKQLKFDFERWALSEAKIEQAEERTVSFD
ncbi:MAG: LemA family protein [Epsilonproteobacteria bacterium]|nr:MAG: LemA family protein [Campylobacterota bacterium]